jgi:hypothetical protein
LQQHIEKNSDPWPGVDYSSPDAFLTRHAALLPSEPLLPQMQQLYIVAMHRTLSRYAPDVNARSGLPIVYVSSN